MASSSRDFRRGSGEQGHRAFGQVAAFAHLPFVMASHEHGLCADVDALAFRLRRCRTSWLLRAAGQVDSCQDQHLTVVKAERLTRVNSFTSPRTFG